MIISTLRFQSAKNTLQDIKEFRKVDKSKYGNNNLTLGIRRLICDAISNMLDLRTDKTETLINLTQISNRYFCSENDIIKEIKKNIEELEKLGYNIAFSSIELSHDRHIILEIRCCKSNEHKGRNSNEKSMERL